MKCLIQRVSHASVTVNNKIESSINQGLLLLLGVEQKDTSETVTKAAEKMLNYRIFSDQDGKMNLSLKTTTGELLIVSQFTLAASTTKGLRPGFSKAASPQLAESLYNEFIEYCAKQVTTKAGIFAANMQIELVNDGPVTFMLET